MVSQTAAGWVLIGIALALLLGRGDVGLLAVLLPISMVVGYGISRLRDNKDALPRSAKQG
jgi:ABC-type Mn2+/Zn2+ transport system permease subunit